jgi:hypothetical protein
VGVIRRAPKTITLSLANLPIPFAASEMRRLQEQTGRDVCELIGDGAHPADQLQALVWLQLSRLGHRVSWEQAGEIRVDFIDADGWG